MAEAWVGALSKGYESNWDVCKDKGLWGSGSARAKNVRAGDEIYIWQSGSGWLARCRVTTDAFPPSASRPAPWDSSHNYKWMFGIEVIRELADTYNPGSTGGTQHITGIYNIQLSQFPALKPHQREGVMSFFGLSNPISDPEEEAHIKEEEDEEERKIEARTDIPVRERETLVMARIGQGEFRRHVLEIETFCRITGLSNREYLIASHIKPWRESDDAEKVDGNNGLMLSPHVDKLFDRGWIKFSDDGFFEPSPLLDENVLTSWRIEQPTNPKPFTDLQIDYLEYHREFIYRVPA